MNEYIVTEEQFLKTLDTVFKTLYKDINYKNDNDNTRLTVYNGKNLRRYIGQNNDGWKLPTFILEYYSNDESLWISEFVYTNIKKYFPPVSNNLLFYDFFKKWFIDKFGIIPKTTHIYNQGTLNDRYKITSS
jgi:hypothetical protein